MRRTLNRQNLGLGFPALQRAKLRSLQNGNSLVHIQNIDKWYQIRIHLEYNACCQAEMGSMYGYMQTTSKRIEALEKL